MPPTTRASSASAALEVCHARAPRRARATSWLVAGALSLGCSGPPGAGRSLGEDLGTFAIAGTLGANDCGSGALGSPAELAYEIELARADTELFWDGRIGGRIGAELDFEVSASTSVELRPPRNADAGCTIVRDDHISGTLEPDASGAVVALRAEMRFSFALRAGSACTAAEQDRAELPRLPCQMSYALSGRRTRAPMARTAARRAREPGGQRSRPAAASAPPGPREATGQREATGPRS